MATVATVGGVLLLLLLAADVLLTVFHPNGHGGPLNRLQNRAVWATFRRAARLLGRARGQRLLDLAGPLLAPVTVAVWAAALVFGCTLLYLPRAADLVQPDAPESASWIEALYYSGYTASTLGLGDLTPTTHGLRILTIVQALSGFMLLTVAVSYIISVYGHRGRETALATDVYVTVRCASDGPDLRLRDGGIAALDGWAAQTARGLALLLQAHAQYPILHYFRTRLRDRELLVQLGALLDLLDRVERQDRDGGPGLRYPGLSVLRETVSLYLDEKTRRFLPRRLRRDLEASARERQDQPSGPGGRRRALDRERLGALLRYAGLDTAPAA